MAVSALFAGCGGGGGGGGSGGIGAVPSSGYLFEKNRNLAGQIEAVLDPSGSNFDANEVDSPSVVVDSGRTNLDKFLLYYEATAGTTSTIGVVSSTEPNLEVLTVSRTQAIGLGGSGSGYQNGATDPCVIVDKGVAFGTNGRYRMWFEGRTGAASAIITCTSGDGVSWSGFTICTGLNASFGSVRVADPTVLLEGATYKMWFEAVDTTIAGGADGPAVIGYAESANGIAWVVEDANGNTGAAADADFLTGPAGAFDDYSVNSPSVAIDTTVAVGTPGRYVLAYEGNSAASNNEGTVGLAQSADGLNWSDPQAPALRPSSDSLVPLPFDSGDLEHPSIAIDDALPATLSGHFQVWYTGDGEDGASPNQIGYAEGNRIP